MDELPGASAAMPRTPTRSHRFVVLWRVEARESDGAAEVRRGWVERVPTAPATDACESRSARVGFQQLADLPVLITRMIEEVEAPRRAAPDRRPSG
jgi:hypothetical protein